MKRIAAICCILAVLFFPAEALASWAYPFVVYNHGTYVVSDEQVSKDRIGKPIGKVTRYSDREGTYGGNFSNIYPKGIVYYKINDISPKQQIAVQADADTYVKAVYQGPYAGREEPGTSGWIYFAGSALVIFAVVLALYHRHHSRMGKR